MSTLKVNSAQIGQSVTATNNFTWYQPSSPDGTVRLGNGNAGSVTDLVTVNSSGNVGIGTSSPATKVEVTGNAAPIVRVTDTRNTVQLDLQPASSTAYFGTNSNHPLAFQTNAVERMKLDTSGNLGLGVTPSGWGSGYKALQISSQLGIAYSGGYAIFANNSYNNSGNKYIANDYATQYYQQGGQHVWSTAPSGTAGNAISFTQAMTLDASGNLLVGTTSALNSERLSVVGGNGILCKTQYAVSSTAVTIAASAGCLLLLRDNNYGQTALILYENASTPIIISQTGSNYTTGTPTGTQIKIQNKSGNQGVSVVMAAGQSTTLNVCVISCDEL